MMLEIILTLIWIGAIMKMVKDDFHIDAKLRENTKRCHKEERERKFRNLI